jgi:hypothetical protein
MIDPVLVIIGRIQINFEQLSEWFNTLQAVRNIGISDPEIVPTKEKGAEIFGPVIGSMDRVTQLIK